jgi:hypothetical protein
MGVFRVVATAVVTMAVGGLVLTACSDARSIESGGAAPGHGTTAASGVPSSTGAGPTAVRTFSPYAATGTIAVPVADQRSGTCWTGSIAVPRPGVYRCLVSNQIYDPCFAPTPETSPVTVVCVADPWSAAYVVTLTKPLPAPSSPIPVDYPWALELANHARCVAVTGTVPTVDGIALNYQCGSDSAAGLIPHVSGQLEVDYGSRSGGPLSEVPVTTAWRG